MNLLDLIWRQWRQRPMRTLLSAFSVAVAVAAVLGAQIARNSVRAGNRNLLKAVDEHPALDVVATEGGRIAAGRLPELNQMAGVAGSFPIVSRATIFRAHGRRVQAILVGLPTEQSAWSTISIVSGRSCNENDEVALAADTARELGVAVGDHVTLLTRHGPRNLTVVGLIDARSLGGLAPGANIAASLATVDECFDLNGGVDRVRVLLNSSDDRARVQSAIRERLSAGLQVQAPAAPAQLADTVLRSTELALQFSAALSVAMAAFIVLNALRMNFTERRREMAVLRVLGATNRQLATLHCVEGAGLGLVGSVLGIPLGLLIGVGLNSVMQRVLNAPAGTIEIDYRTMAWAVLIGPLVAGAAAIVPAWQSRRVSPREAMTGAEPRSAERFPLWATATGAIAMLAGLVLMLLVTTSRLTAEMAIPAGLLMLLAFVAVLPVLIEPIARAAALLLQPFWPLGADLATGQLLQRRIRTGLTAGVLVVAVNACLGMGNSIINNVNDVEQWHRRWLTGDVSLFDTSADESGRRGAADRTNLREQLLAQPHVATVLQMQFLAARANDVAASCVARDFFAGEELPWVIAAGDVEQTAARLKAGDAVIGSVLAQRLGLHEGDSLRLEVAGRALSVPIAAIANDYAVGGMVVYLDRSAAAERLNLGPPALYLVRATPNASTSALLEELAPLAKQSGLVLRSFAEVHEQLDRLIHGIVGALWGLLAVGFVVGCMAVANALTMNVLEQTAELGLLRILGMTRRQVRGVVLCESFLLGILGTLLGVVAGVVTAAIIHFCNEPLLGHAVPFKFHAALLLANAAGCLLVALLAGWSPGAKAARLDLTAAIAYE